MLKAAAVHVESSGLARTLDTANVLQQNVAPADLSPSYARWPVPVRRRAQFGTRDATLGGCCGPGA